MERKRFSGKRKNLLAVTVTFSGLAVLFFNGCAFSLSSTEDMEPAELRQATDKEASLLKDCLTAIHKEQNNYFKQNKRFISLARDLHVDEYCQGLQVGVRAKKNTFDAIAKIRKDDTEVTWLIDEAGEIQQKETPSF